MYIYIYLYAYIYIYICMYAEFAEDKVVNVKLPKPIIATARLAEDAIAKSKCAGATFAAANLLKLNLLTYQMYASLLVRVSIYIYIYIYI